MEENRLKPMPEAYDRELFNVLYKKTEQLRKKLAYEIDARKFGVDYKEVLSWFDVKFIYTFQKYCNNKEPELLKGYIINSLKVFKCRVLRKSYTQREQLNNTVDITDLYDYDSMVITEDSNSAKDLFYSLAMEFLQKNLSDEAMFLLKLELDPPSYILTRIKRARKELPPQLIAEYLGMEESPESFSYLKELKKEIESAMIQAREYLNLNTELSF